MPKKRSVLTEDDRIQSTPRASKDKTSYEYARQMVFVLKQFWKSLETTVGRWEKEVEEARQNKIWEKLGYSDLDELLLAEIGATEHQAQKEVKSREQGKRENNAKVHQAQADNPDWTQQKIGDETELDQSTVSRLMRERDDSSVSCIQTVEQEGNELKLSKQTVQALRKLREHHPELHARVEAKELSVNAAAIEAGFRKKPTPMDTIKRVWKKLTEEEKDEIRLW